MPIIFGVRSLTLSVFCIVTSEDFRLFFEKFGSVLDSIVLVDKLTNRSRGFGFVTFEHARDAKKLMNMGQLEGKHPENPTSTRLEMQGKLIEVKYAEPKESSRRMQYDAANQSIPSACAVTVQPGSPYPYYYGQPSHAPVGAVFAGYAAPMYYMPAIVEYPYLPEYVPMFYHPPTPHIVPFLDGVENPENLLNAAISGHENIE